ncbi:10224_t:CDS:2, partial [Racocetra fulgida]
DVVQYRQTVFLPMMKELEPILLEYCDKDLTILLEKDIFLREKRYCIIIYNETILSTNDDKKTGEYKLHPKGQGRGIHVSEFLCEPLGQVHLTKEQHIAYPEISKHYITELLEIGNIELLAKQLKLTIDILKIALSNMIFVFGFDNKQPKRIKEVMIERRIWNE